MGEFFNIEKFPKDLFSNNQKIRKLSFELINSKTFINKKDLNYFLEKCHFSNENIGNPCEGVENSITIFHQYRTEGFSETKKKTQSQFFDLLEHVIFSFE